MNFRDQVQKEAYEALMSQNRASGDISVRLGKTLIGLKISQNYNKVLVTYPNCSIKNSWINDSIKFGISLDHITFSTNLSISKHNLNDYDCIIFDEIDTLSLANWQYIEQFDHKVMKGLTGTMPSKGEKRQYINSFCPVVYSIKLDETTGKTSKDYQIIVHLLKADTNKNIPLKSGKYWSEAGKIGFWESKWHNTKSFNQAMLPLIQAIQNSHTKFNYVRNLVNKIDRCLIFLETSKQCDDLGIHSYHSKNKDSDNNLELFQNGTIDKLATINQLKAGITFHNLNTCIILHSYASEAKSHQKLARVLNYADDEMATIHIICLKDTYDEKWCRKFLSQFDQEKIQYINGK